MTNHIRADRRAQFEEAITSFWNAGSRAGALDSTGTATFAHTRVLYPVAPDSDGTYAYLFIMDPYITGANYSIDSLLKRLFPAADAARLNQAIEGAMASPQVSRRVVQHIP